MLELLSNTSDFLRESAVACYETVMDPPILQDLVISLVVLVAAFYGSRWNPKLVPTEGQQAWVLTLISSTLLSCLTLFCIADFASFNYDVPAFVAGGSQTVPQFMIIFFLAYLWCDLILGYLYYPSKVQILTGYIHHAGYSLLMIWGLRRKMAHIYGMCFIIEYPTIFLALGHLRKQWRQDIIFGSLFFLTRIVVHAYVCYEVYLHVKEPLWISIAAVYPVHIYWFYGFIRQQMRLATKSKTMSIDASNKKDATTTSTPTVAATTTSTADNTAATLDGVKIANKGENGLHHRHVHASEAPVRNGA